MPDSKTQGAPIIRGVDVFHGDTPLDFHALFAAGVKYAFVKVTQGLAYNDVLCKSYVVRAKSVGMLTGEYHFLDPNADGAAQARHFLNRADCTKGDLLPVLDVETMSRDGDGATVAACALAFARTIKLALGRYPIIYSGDCFYEDNLKATFPVGTYHLWIARYGRSPDTQCEFWQNADNRQYPNNRPLDGDLFYGTMADLLTLTLGG